ncbi:MAG: gamma-glutamyltransferase [Solirubrobacterales bacterium]|nr:gamma-glutamyltransferase [Solirubrobacterales bacterium]
MRDAAPSTGCEPSTHPREDVSAGRQLGVVAAGHPLTARAGADVLREGGNAVDAALGAMLASFVCEPLLTGLGAGGYMLVVAPGSPAVLLDFFVQAPGRGAVAGAREELVPISVSFGDAIQVFNIGPASVGAFGMPAGVCEAAARFGRIPLEQLVRPAVALARRGVELSVEQAYVFEILGGIATATPESAALFAPQGRVPTAGERIRQPELADSLERLGREGAAPFYTGDIGAAIVDWVVGHGGILTAADLESYAVVDRPPVSVGYRGRLVLTNPPPSAGGILIARALALLEAAPGPPSVEQIVEVMERTQRERTPEFLAGLDDPEFVERFLHGKGEAGRGPGAAQRGPLGSTTHIAVLDSEGWACSVTCSNGSCSGVVVPGTGVHLNNMLGEQDLNPLGFHRHPPGRRLPSMMAPTALLRDGTAELVLGSAGSNRIRSAILQTIIRVIDEGMLAADAVGAPRLHYEEGVVYAEPGADTAALEASARPIGRFRDRNLFFGGVQAAARELGGGFSGGGDPRRGGAAIVVSDR